MADVEQVTERLLEGFVKYWSIYFDMTAGAWFDVSVYDAFPVDFLFPDEGMQQLFRGEHADPFTADGWKQFQAQIEDCVICDVCPYSLSDRLWGWVTDSSFMFFRLYYRYPLLSFLTFMADACKDEYPGCTLQNL